MTDLLLMEEELLLPVQTLFPAKGYWQFEQVPLGRKKIDLVCVERLEPNLGASIELKIRDWRKALWQAAVNFQLTDKSYIAIWHEYIHRPQRELALLNDYGVGLIAVHRDTAEIVCESTDQVRRLSRDARRNWYKQLLNRG